MRKRFLITLLFIISVGVLVLFNAGPVFALTLDANAALTSSGIKITWTYDNNWAASDMIEIKGGPNNIDEKVPATVLQYLDRGNFTNDDTLAPYTVTVLSLPALDLGKGYQTGNYSVVESGIVPVNSGSYISGGTADNPQAPQKGPQIGDIWDIFCGNQWDIAMQFYDTLALLSGAFIFIANLRIGYQYFTIGENPSVRADFFSMLQRVFIAIALIIFMPFILNDILIPVNNGFVSLFANILGHYNNLQAQQYGIAIGGEGIFTSILTSPFQVIESLISYVLGLHSIPTLIFNGSQALNSINTVFGSFTNVTTNPFANIIIKLGLDLFKIYFNALFTIRKLVVIGCFVATPLLVWVWVITEEKQVLEILIGEIVSSVFMQSAYALTFAIFFSVISGANVPKASNVLSTNNVVTGVGIHSLSAGMITMGEWVASFAGVIGLFVLIISGYRLMTATDDRSRASAITRIKGVVIGLPIIGLALVIASYIATIISTAW